MSSLPEKGCMRSCMANGKCRLTLQTLLSLTTKIDLSHSATVLVSNVRLSLLIV